MIADSGPTCDVIRARLPLMRAACCAHSSYMQREPGLAAGLKAYNVGPNHVYHLWWQRWHYAAAGVAAGYNMLMLDADISLRGDPYPLLRTLSHSHALVTIPPGSHSSSHMARIVHPTAQHTAQLSVHPTAQHSVHDTLPCSTACTPPRIATRRRSWASTRRLAASEPSTFSPPST